MAFPQEIRDEDVEEQKSASEAFRMHDPLQRTVNGAPLTVRVCKLTALMHMLRHGLDTTGGGDG